ncbi:Zinc finger, RING-type [Penicillium digitatum]|uniref:Zinc finger, RING-type n=1 Tax=Penicillium digitatum TaxID=36651 RepID=A0A7T6XTB9_PENDI|nr:Zinc finger, RING-type [Penicillium digitatum]
MSPSKTPTPDPLDPISTWRAWQTLTIIYTILLNRQIRRRWLLEQICMQDNPLYDRFQPLIFLEPVPTLQEPNTNPTPSKYATNNPFNRSTMHKLRTRAAVLRARVEKGKELASEIERRMVQDPPTSVDIGCVGLVLDMGLMGTGFMSVVFVLGRRGL